MDKVSVMSIARFDECADTAQAWELGSVKWCSRGKHFVARAGFNGYDHTSDGLQHWCRECQRSYYREHKRRLSEERQRKVLDWHSHVISKTPQAPRGTLADLADEVRSELSRKRKLTRIERRRAERRALLAPLTREQQISAIVAFIRAREAYPPSQWYGDRS
jgi:hypothetical protein